MYNFEEGIQREKVNLQGHIKQNILADLKVNDLQAHAEFIFDYKGEQYNGYTYNELMYTALETRPKGYLYTLYLFNYKTRKHIRVKIMDGMPKPMVDLNQFPNYTTK